ncbi:helix-turn-helix domain-containing protein [Streptococcus agalactiae]|uniref:helix-turn-helix domain-containing protein n=1 Tax=Streptococcus agalactiae TaxID=1311 RepID=UPI003C74B24E
MIENYLEKNILNKVKLLILCYDTPSLSLNTACNRLHLSAADIKNYCHKLNILFDHKLSIHIQKEWILCKPNKLTQDEALKMIYNESNTLQFLKFLIDDSSDKKSLVAFGNEHFLSRSSIYRMRENLIPLIEDLGLSLSKNTIVGDEYRIRYLIAYLTAKFGIEIYDLSAFDNKVIRQFLFESATNIKPTTHLSDVFMFFDTLLILSWKRHHHKVKIPNSKLFSALKKIFIYEELNICVKGIIQPYFDVIFDADDIDYIFLIYLTSANSFAAQKWTDAHINDVLVIFENLPKFQLLLEALKKTLPNSHDYCNELIEITIYFSRTFILGLNQLIPETLHFPSHFYPGDPQLVTIIKPIVTNWLNEIGESTFKKQHFFLFCAHLERVIKNNMPPIRVVLLTTDFINNQIFKNYLLQSLSLEKINFHSYYLLRDNVSQVSTLKPDLIITNQKLVPYVTKELATNSLVAHIDYNDTPTQISNIQTIISNIKEEKYRKIFDKI